jgi:hypothetical protein
MSRVAIQIFEVVSNPTGGRIAVLRRSGKPVLGSQTVVDGDHNTSGSIRYTAADRVMGIEITKNPAATMKVHDDGKRARAIRCIHADGDLRR